MPIEVTAPLRDLGGEELLVEGDQQDVAEVHDHHRDGHDDRVVVAGADELKELRIVL
jgi:hypothetical protein